jgi:class 3 adenylate cyclase
VLCSAEVRETAGEGFRWSEAGRRRLKGVERRVELVRVRAAGDDRDG